MQVSELERVITTLRSESQILRDALSSKDEDIEQALTSKTELEKQLAAVTDEKNEAIEKNNVLENKLRQKEEEFQKKKTLPALSSSVAVNTTAKDSFNEVCLFYILFF